MAGGHRSGIRDEGESSVNVRFMGFMCTDDSAITRCPATASCPAAGHLPGAVGLPGRVRAGAEGS
ncbi:hypothetical protein [Streptomyces humicola]|uniref:hypothetical protein n=1 Tax=Streptomyces humicola TaxID=2953240 RepID=UPI00355802C0